MLTPTEKRDFLFRYVDPPVRTQLRFDEEAMYSTTDQVTADKITRDLARLFAKTAAITDGTACVGGNTYSFAQYFNHVRAYELDPLRADLLVANMRVLGANNVAVSCGDVLALAPSETEIHDVVFLDPPWGGPDYKNEASVSLYLSGMPLAVACQKLAPCTRYIALKVPTNFNEAEFLRDTEAFLELKHRNVHLRKMHLLVLKNILLPEHK